MSRSDRQTMSPTESLMSAIRSFDADKVEELLTRDFEIEYRHEDHHSVLHTAVSLMNPETLNKVRYKEESDRHLIPSYDHNALRRIVEALLQSGRFDVNALTDTCETVLHVAVGSCFCKVLCGDDYKDMVNTIIELLLKKKPNINAKTTPGSTPLIRASHHGCRHIVKLLIDWRDEHGAGVDLNARNIYGETALIKAAKRAHFDVIDLFLEHGCLDEFHDHRGFCALHAAIYGSDEISDASSDFLSLIGLLTGKATAVVLERYAGHSGMGNAIYEDWTKIKDIEKTVKMLVTRGKANINSKDFGGNTVLDLALKSKLRVSQDIVEQLKKHGATSEHPEYPAIALEYTDKQGKTPLHRLHALLPDLTLGEKIEIFLLHVNGSHCNEAFKEMTVAKDHRGRTVLHYAVIPSIIIDVALQLEDIIQLIKVLKLKPNINARDKYGRTPLHYCEDEGIYKSLLQQGADEHIQDIDGKTPRDIKIRREEEHERYDTRGKLEDQIRYGEKIDAFKMWKYAEYAFLDTFSERICDKVRQFIDRLSDEIGKKDPRFECRPVLIGSAEEGTKTGLPDEFDFNFILTKLSKLCDVVLLPEAPSGFVHLKRKSHDAPCRDENPCVGREENFDEIFGSKDFLLTAEIASRFRILCLQVLSEAKFWKDESFFEWDPCSEVGMKYDKEKSQFDPSEFSRDLPDHPCNTIQLKLNRPIEGRYMFTRISVDILPCIKLNGWWPENTLSSLSDEIKCEGCHLVFDQPQRNYPRVPFSNPFARISFAPAEVRFMKECSAVARAAYMVGKQLLHKITKFSYVLKTCLLYCIEALHDRPRTRNSTNYEAINPVKLKFFVEKLMLCFHEFYQQDFLPCYMMPSFHLPIEHYLKSNHYSLLNEPDFQYPSFFHELYTKVCTKGSPAAFRPPTPEPLNENFDREDLLNKLSAWSNINRKRRKQPNTDKTKVKRKKSAILRQNRNK